LEHKLNQLVSVVLEQQIQQHQRQMRLILEVQQQQLQRQLLSLDQQHQQQPHKLNQLVLEDLDHHLVQRQLVALVQQQQQRLHHHLVHHHQQLNQSQHLVVLVLEIQLEALDKQLQLVQQQLRRSVVLGQLD
jgi:hypothetical protein